jgi:hypothetical protein
MDLLVQLLRLILGDAVWVVWLHILAQPALDSITHKRLKVRAGLLPAVRVLLLLLRCLLRPAR